MAKTQLAGLTGARLLDGDPSVFHGNPLLRVRGVGTLLDVDVGHVLPVSCEGLSCQ